MFVGRTRELQALQTLYEAGHFQMPVIYGRRRVGKTSLIKEFIKDKRAIFFTGIESNLQQNLDNLSASIFAWGSSSTGSSPVFPSFQGALEHVFQMALETQLVLVLDEYPYAAKADPSLSSVLQGLIDRYKQSSRLFLILCGSSMSFMEEQVLGYQSPLYGRRTAQFKLLPFGFRESCSFFSSFSARDLAMIYGMTGGTPQYLEQMDERLSLEDNIKQKLLTPSAYLFEEPNNLLKQEVREAALYNAVIAAIANGNSKLVEIANRAGIPTSACSAYLKNLISLGIVKRETPLGEKAGRRSIYVISDLFFRFWYRFVPGNLSLLEQGMMETAYARIALQLSDYMGPVFEEICSQHLWALNQQGEAAIPFVQLGRWWGNDPRTRRQVEIDLVGTSGSHEALFAECKWTNEPVDVGVLSALVDKSSLFPQPSKAYYVFSKNGFTSGCRELAASLSAVHLVAFDRMMGAQ